MTRQWNRKPRKLSRPIDPVESTDPIDSLNSIDSSDSLDSNDLNNVLDREEGAATLKVSTGRTVGWLIIITALTKSVGFAREILFGRWYGVGEVAEAFKIAQTIPMVLLLIVGTGISTGFIPIYTELSKTRNEKSADEFMSNLTNVLILLSIAFSLIVTIFPGVFVKMFASGFTGSKYQLTILYTQIAVWGTLFNMVTYIMAPYLQIKNEFMAPALMVIPGNIVFILCFYLGLSSDPTIIAFSIVLAIMVQLLWLIPYVRKYGYRFIAKIDLSDPYLRRFFYMAAPVVVGVAVNQVNLMVDKNIASYIMDGGVAIMDYANRMTNFIQAIFIYPVAAVFFPKLSRFILDQKFGQAQKNTTDAFIFLTLIVLPCSAGLMIFADPIVELLFGGDAFTQQALGLIGQAMFWYATGLLFWAWRDIFIRVYFAFGNTTTPTRNAIIGVVINITFNLVLSRYLGLSGLAIATSISGVVSSLLMLRGLRSYKGFKLNFRVLWNRTVQVIAATLLMSLGARLTFDFLKAHISNTMSLFASVGIAVVIYSGLILMLQIPEVIQIVGPMFRKKRHK